MKSASREVFAQALALREEGRNHKEIMGQLGLSHSQMERAFMAADIEAGLIKGGFLAQPETQTEKGAIIARLRLAGESWGLISVRFREPESRTRKAFAEAGGLDSKGLRIGKGGRWVADDPRPYTGADRAALGSEFVAAKPLRPQIEAIDPNAEKVARRLPTVAKGKKPRAPRKPKQLAITAGE